MPNGPVGRKLQRFKCMSKASAYIYSHAIRGRDGVRATTAPHMPERCAGELSRGI
jgi:hypothetical protein